MKEKSNDHRYSNKTENIRHIKTDMKLYPLNIKQNNNYLQPNNNIEINSIDIDTLLDKTQNSLDDFVTSLTQEENVIKKSTKNIPKKNNGLYVKLNKINSTVDTSSNPDLNREKIYNYDKDIKNIIAKQRKLLGNNNEKYKTLNSNINEVNNNNFPIMKNRKIHRRKVDSNNLNNKNKKIDVSPNSNYLINDDFTKRTFNKVDISPLQMMKKSLNNNKSFDGNINEINKHKKIIDMFNKKNKFLIKENEKYKKEINYLKNYIDNLEKENIELKQNYQRIDNNLGNNNLSISNEYFSIYKKNNLKNKDLVSILKKEIKKLKEELNKYKNDEIKKSKNNCAIEHDINNDQLEKITKENNDLKEQNIFLINELNNIKKNQDFILTNNFLNKKNKSLNIQIINLKKKLKNYNNLQIYIKLLLQNKNEITDEKEQFLIRKIQDELGLIQQKQKNGHDFLQLNNNINNYFNDENNDELYNINE